VYIGKYQLYPLHFSEHRRQYYDFVVFGILHGLATKWYLVPVVAAIWFAAYYAIFRFAITRFNLKTPGRDIDTAASVEKAVAGTIGKSGITYRRFWRRSATQEHCFAG
jgi:hypothetical protein